jgi:N-acetylmuramoyl-L-alanine amidase
MRHITAIVVHCAATPNGKPFTAADIDRWHRERGWRKIGYHYVILLGGTVETGRELWEVGAHTEGNNSKTIGICMIGTDKFTELQWRALWTLHEQLYGMFPHAAWLGHRDYSPDRNGDGQIQPWEWTKTCPGFDVRQWIIDSHQPKPENVLLP